MNSQDYNNNKINKYTQDYHQTINNHLYLHKELNIYKTFKRYVIHVKNQNAQYSVQEYVVDHIIRNVIKKY